MSAWSFLAGAIALEVAGTLCLRAASVGRKLWYLPVAIGYLASMACLTAALERGLGLGVAYGVWTACGVALTAIASKMIFKEALNWITSAGIMLIAAGVLLVEMGARHGAAGL